MGIVTPSADTATSQGGWIKAATSLAFTSAGTVNLALGSARCVPLQRREWVADIVTPSAATAARCFRCVLNSQSLGHGAIGNSVARVDALRASPCRVEVPGASTTESQVYVSSVEVPGAEVICAAQNRGTACSGPEIGQKQVDLFSLPRYKTSERVTTGFVQQNDQPNVGSGSGLARATDDLPWVKGSSGRRCRLSNLALSPSSAADVWPTF